MGDNRNNRSGHHDGHPSMGALISAMEQRQSGSSSPAIYPTLHDHVKAIIAANPNLTETEKERLIATSMFPNVPGSSYSNPGSFWGSMGGLPFNLGMQPLPMLLPQTTIPGYPNLSQLTADKVGAANGLNYPGLNAMSPFLKMPGYPPMSPGGNIPSLLHNPAALGAYSQYYPGLFQRMPQVHPNAMLRMPMSRTPPPQSRSPEISTMRTESPLHITNNRPQSLHLKENLHRRLSAPNSNHQFRTPPYPDVLGPSPPQPTDDRSRSSAHIDTKSIGKRIQDIISQNEKILCSPQLDRVKPRRVTRRNSLDTCTLTPSAAKHTPLTATLSAPRSLDKYSRPDNLLVPGRSDVLSVPHHNPRRTDPNHVSYRCDSCGAVFSQHETLEIHRREYCRNRARESPTLRRSVIQHTEPTPLDPHSDVTSNGGPIRNMTRDALRKMHRDLHRAKSADYAFVTNSNEPHKDQTSLTLPEPRVEPPLPKTPPTRSSIPTSKLPPKKKQLQLMRSNPHRETSNSPASDISPTETPQLISEPKLRPPNSLPLELLQPQNNPPRWAPTSTPSPTQSFESLPMIASPSPTHDTSPISPKSPKSPSRRASPNRGSRSPSHSPTSNLESTIPRSNYKLLLHQISLRNMQDMGYLSEAYHHSKDKDLKRNIASLLWTSPKSEGPSNRGQKFPGEVPDLEELYPGKAKLARRLSPNKDTRLKNNDATKLTLSQSRSRPYESTTLESHTSVTRSHSVEASSDINSNIKQYLQNKNRNQRAGQAKGHKPLTRTNANARYLIKSDNRAHHETTRQISSKAPLRSAKSAGSSAVEKVSDSLKRSSSCNPESLQEIRKKRQKLIPISSQSATSLSALLPATLVTASVPKKKDTPVAKSTKPHTVQTPFLLHPHASPSFGFEPHPTFCSLVSPQPMYVELEPTTPSMYSQWAVSEPILPKGMTVKDIFENTRQLRAMSPYISYNTLFTESHCKGNPLKVIESKDYEKPDQAKESTSTKVDSSKPSNTTAWCFSRMIETFHQAPTFCYTSCHDKTRHSEASSPVHPPKAATVKKFPKLCPPKVFVQPPSPEMGASDGNDEVIALEFSDDDSVDDVIDLECAKQDDTTAKEVARGGLTESNVVQKEKGERQMPADPTLAVHPIGACSEDPTKICALCRMKAPKKTDAANEKGADDKSSGACPPSPEICDKSVSAQTCPRTHTPTSSKPRVPLTVSVPKRNRDRSVNKCGPLTPGILDKARGKGMTQHWVTTTDLHPPGSSPKCTEPNSDKRPPSPAQSPDACDSPPSSTTQSKEALAAIVSGVMRSAAIQTKKKKECPKSEMSELLSHSRPLVPVSERNGSSNKTAETDESESKESSLSSLATLTSSVGPDQSDNKVDSELDVWRKSEESYDDDGTKDDFETDMNPRPHKCAECKVAFRIAGHLAKHLRSKGHIVAMQKKTLNRLKQQKLSTAQDSAIPGGQGPVSGIPDPSPDPQHSEELLNQLGEAQVRALFEGNEEYAEIHTETETVPEVSDDESGDLQTGSSDPRPFKCIVCKVAFRFQGHLDRHFRSNTHLLAVGHFERDASSVVCSPDEESSDRTEKTSPNKNRSDATVAKPFVDLKVQPISSEGQINGASHNNAPDDVSNSEESTLHSQSYNKKSPALRDTPLSSSAPVPKIQQLECSSPVAI